MIKNALKENFTKEKADIYYSYLRILEDELIPAMGCTEPISLAYAAAKARGILGDLPDKIDVVVSGNIIKNVKSVVVPNTNGLKGIKAAVAAGVISGREDKVLEVLSELSAEQKNQIINYLQNTIITVSPASSDLNFDIVLTLFKGSSYSKLRIIDDHTNVVLIEKNGEILYTPEKTNSHVVHNNDKLLLNIEDIFKFAILLKSPMLRSLFLNKFSTTWLSLKKA